MCSLTIECVLTHVFPPTSTLLLTHPGIRVTQLLGSVSGGTIAHAAGRPTAAPALVGMAEGKTESVGGNAAEVCMS